MKLITNVVGSGAEISYVGSDDGTKRGIYIQSGASLTVSGTSKKLTIDMSQSKESRAAVRFLLRMVLQSITRRTVLLISKAVQLQVKQRFSQEQAS